MLTKSLIPHETLLPLLFDHKHLRICSNWFQNHLLFQFHQHSKNCKIFPAQQCDFKTQNVNPPQFVSMASSTCISCQKSVSVSPAPSILKQIHVVWGLHVLLSQICFNLSIHSVTSNTCLFHFAHMNHVSMSPNQD